MRSSHIFFIGLGIVTYLSVLGMMSPMPANADTNVIYSTELGGAWNVKTTWVGQIFPNPSDKVIIQGAVEGASNYDGIYHVGSLEITSTGSLTDGALYVHGNVLNNGSINNHLMKVEGDITNNSIWNDRSTIYLMGETPRKINGTKPTYAHMEINGDIELTSSATIGGRLSLSSGDLAVNSGNSLTLLGDFHLFGNIIADKIIIGGSDQRIGAVTAERALYADNVVFTGGGTKEFYTTFFSIHADVEIDSGVELNGTSISVFGDITNRGTILNSSMRVEGDIRNDGIWENSSRLLLMNGGKKYFGGSNLVQADVEIQGDTIFVNSPTFAGNLFSKAKQFVIAPGNTLTLLGDLFTHSFVEADEIIIKGESQSLTAYDSRYGFIAPSVRFEGIGEVDMQSTFSIYGDLRIGPGRIITGSAIYVYGNVVNNGTVKNSFIAVAGDIDNNGVWKELKLTCEKEDAAIGYNYSIANEDKIWAEIESSSSRLYDAKSMLNESRLWRVQKKYSDGKVGEWSEIHAINAGNLIDESKDYVYTPAIKKDEVEATNDTVPTKQVENSFSDVPDSAYYSSELSQLIDDGVIQGYPDGTFKPNQTINRAEVLKIAMVAAGLELAKNDVKSYSDVKKVDWFSTYVQTATQKKIVQGYNDGTFKPGNLINRAEALKIILLSAGETVSNCESDLRFSDVPESAWFYPYVCRAEELGILDRLSGAFDGAKEISRAEVVYWVGQM